MAAMNQLALIYLERARRTQGAAGKKAATQALELAALVCAQGLKKNPRWAPLYNTLGLVEVELGNLSRAAAAFDDARRLDPRLVEAHMNIAALNVEVRGFARAEEAYRAVLALRPDDYDAHVGLALAIRGQIDDASESDRVALATRELETAIHIAPQRPDAYLNQGILVQEYGARNGDPSASLKSLARAKELYERFIDKADGNPAYAAAKDRAKQRLDDIARISDLVLHSQPAP
jgi:tetratricopeptide (TPR) repeat protein